MFTIRSASAFRTLARPAVMRNVAQNAGRRAISIKPRPPIMEREVLRPLPDPNRPRRLFLMSIPAFLVVLIGSGAVIFNYQKSSSSVTTSTLYAVRTNPKAREALGPEIGFKEYLPWIWGTVDQLHGIIDIQYKVRGKKDWGWVVFKSERVGGRQGEFKTGVWELRMRDGTVVDLMEGSEGPL
ncbi:DUF1783-domain-containing protein [Ascobolus immersus RN42]|uniref:DUF1783-domain-containing protein n=1 Tax=Ascobolus immersus RN42 TaxID=1160509 RepID=A0A3N4IH10_ASCIM|nr:DUF1783-domain-containing protein [Ascobolus immersus RN42]